MVAKTILFFHYPWRLWRARLAGVCRYARKVKWRVQVIDYLQSGLTVKQALAFPAGKEEPQHAVYPVTILKLLPFLAVPVTLFALYVLYCIQDVRHRAAAFRFDPMMKMRGKR